MSVMRYLDMLPKVTSRKQASEPYLAHSSKWVRAPASGILNLNKQLGERVLEGETIGFVSDPSDMFVDEKVEFFSPFDGIVIGHTKVPLVNEGDAVFHIAGFANAREVAAELETFQEEILDV